MNVKLVFNSILHAAAVAAMLIAPAESWAQRAKKPGSGGGGGPTVVVLHPAGATYSRAWGVNDGGRIVGHADSVAGTWDGNATTPTFTPLPGSGWVALGQNDGGEIVGSGGRPDLTLPYYWETATATPIALPLSAGAQWGQALAISLDGVIVGTAGSSAIAWRIVEGWVFGPVVLSSNSDALGVAVSGSDTNRAVGLSAASGAIMWDLAIEPDGSFRVVSSSSPDPALHPDSIVTAITNDGDMTGRTWDTRRREHRAFVIHSGTPAYLLPNGRQNYGIGFALNGDRVVGSTAEVFLAPPVASLWDSGRQYSILPSTWSQSEAHGINASGLIVGHGTDASGQSKAWLLR